MLSRCTTQALTQRSVRNATVCSSSQRQLSNYTRRPNLNATFRNGKAFEQRQRVSTWDAAKIQFRKSPVTFPLAMIVIAFGFAGLAYVPFYYQKYIIAPYHTFPEPVAKELRKAIYFTNISWDPQRALSYYKKGILIANELGVDPFSNEMIGIKIQVATVFKRLGAYDKCIGIYETLRNDCIQYVQELGDKHWNDGKRTRVLAKAVALSLKLGELYSSDHVLNRQAAEERLVWAVETVLREKHRRDVDGVQPGEGDWVTDEEFGAALESLGHNYEAKDQHYLATPLFVRALSLSPPKSCHSVVLMSNIATCLAQQTPPPTRLPPKQPTPKYSILAQKPLPPTNTSLSHDDYSFPSSPAPSRTVLRTQAEQWAQSALDLALSIEGSDRTKECDLGCAVATHNLGEFAEASNRVGEARHYYTNAKALSKRLNFDEGVENATLGLRRIEKLTGESSA